MQPPIVVDLLKEFHQRFINLKSKWTQTFLEVDSSHSILMKDLETTHRHVSGLKNRFSRLEESQQKQTLQVTSKLDYLSKLLEETGSSNATVTSDLLQLQRDFEAMQLAATSSSDEVDLRLHDLILH